MLVSGRVYKVAVSKRLCCFVTNTRTSAVCLVRSIPARR